MPYIADIEREALDRWLVDMPKLQHPGQIAFVLTRLMQRGRNKFEGFGGFFARALVAGVVVLTLLEFFRRDVTPYEEGRRAENGEVY